MKSSQTTKSNFLCNTKSVSHVRDTRFLDISQCQQGSNPKDNQPGGGVRRHNHILRRSISAHCQRIKETLSPRNFFLRLLPTQFSTDTDSDTINADPRTVRLNVYRINDSIGFYHTGLVFSNKEYTYCQNRGICKHSPRDVDFASFLGSIRLGKSMISDQAFHQILQDMRDNGFSHEDYDIMQNSCNIFTEELARRLDLVQRYPTGVLNQSKIGGILSPLARALDLLPDQTQSAEGQNDGGQQRPFRIIPSGNIIKTSRSGQYQHRGSF